MGKEKGKMELDWTEILREAQGPGGDINAAVVNALKRINAWAVELKGCWRDCPVRAAFGDKTSCDTARHMIHDERHKHQQALRQVMTRGPEAILADQGAMQEVYEDILNSWLLPDGRVLGDATGEELVPLAEEHGVQSREHGQIARFYARVAAACGGRVVRKTLDNDALRRLWRQGRGRGPQEASAKQKAA